jgi:hypothetical protein
MRKLGSMHAGDAAVRLAWKVRDRRRAARQRQWPTILASLLLMSGCATATPQYPQTRDGWAYQINPASDRIDFRVGNAQWMREISAGFLWFDLAQACQDHRAGSAAQLAKAKPYMFESAQQKPAIGLSKCRQASVTVNEGGMWGYMKPDGSRAVGTTTERTCEQELASDVIRRVMPIAQRNCIAVSITWK